MKIYPECVPCLLKRVLYEVELIDPKKGHEAMKTAGEIIFRDYRDDVVSVDIATKVHHAIYDLLADEDPYKGMKERSNEAAMGIMGRMREFLSRSPKGSVEALRDHCIVSIIGNVLDFGIRGGIGRPEALSEIIDGLIAQGLGRDDTPAIHNLLSSSKEGPVVIVGDNAGEIVLDTLLVAYIRAVYEREVIYVVRGGPILSDATMEDAERVGMTSAATRVLTTNSRYVGLNLDMMDDELRRAIDSCVLFIAKGMANFEALSERQDELTPLVYMLRTKCRPVALSLGEEVDQSIVKLYI